MEVSSVVFSPFYPNVVFVIPAPISAALLCSRRNKLHIVCFRVNTKARSFRCSSSSPKSLLTFRGPRLSQSHIPFGRSFSCYIPNVPLDRQRDGLKFKGGYKFIPQVVGIENTQKLSELLKKSYCKKTPPQVVGIENPKKTTP